MEPRSPKLHKRYGRFNKDEASDEIERRLDEVHSGRDPGVPMEEAHAAIRAELEADRSTR